MNAIAEMMEELKLNIKLTLADLANANAEVACLKYENDQLKKEIERLKIACKP